jgi:hypothetical protein
MGGPGGEEPGVAEGRRITAEHTAGLGPDEEPVLLVRARVPRYGTGLVTFPPVGLLVRAFDAVSNRRHLQHLRREGAAIGLPLDRRMTMLVTSQRLLVWRERGSRGPEPLGALDLDDVLTARLPFVGGGAWRFVELHLRSGYLVRFQVEGALADQFVERLGRSPADPG